MFDVLTLVLSAVVVLLTVQQVWFDRRLAALRVSVYQEGVDNSERHLEVIALADAMDHRVREHTHHLDYAERIHDHEHDHPHQHEHVQHTHTLVPLSRHDFNGRAIVVKRCETCETIFRDQAEA